MKKLIYLIILISLVLFSGPSVGQTLIAVQNESTSSFYNSLDSAIINATNGDYIYLPGGSFKITVPIEKQLNIIGAGHNPDSCAATGITVVVGNFNINSGSDHGSLTGLKIGGEIIFTTNENQFINYYSIERCNIMGVYLTPRSSNILINECIVTGIIQGEYAQGFQLSKCIVEAGSISNFDSNAYFINNIFIESETLYNVSGCSFRNNIFLNSAGNSTGYTNTYQNNLFNGVYSFIGNQILLNNITGPVSTLFKNQSETVFDYKQDYHILDTSPAHNAGTDGTDLGIYGTGSPWKEGSLPSNPHIQSKTISTVNGNLNVKIKVAAQDY